MWRRCMREGDSIGCRPLHNQLLPLYDPKHGWSTMSRVDLPIRGGRGGGYRTYSMKTGITPGAWRINIETPAGALLGRLRFNVVLQPSDPPLITQLKN